jgi:hypothetical protein
VSRESLLLALAAVIVLATMGTVAALVASIFLDPHGPVPHVGAVALFVLTSLYCVVRSFMPEEEI